MHPHLIHKLLTVFILSLSSWSHAQEEQEPEKVDFDSNKWKTSDNLTIKTLNNTKRTFTLNASESGKNRFEQFVYIPATQNNKESYKVACKHIPAFHKETKATITANIAWSLKDKDKKDIQKEKIQYWSLPYEVDLKDLSGNTLNVVCARMEATKKDPESSSGEEKKRGAIHYGTIYDADLMLGVKSMTFNTHPGTIKNDAFDVVDCVKGKVINNTPEFLDGKQAAPSTIVVYPVDTKPAVAVTLQLKSKRLTADKLQELDWKPQGETHVKEKGEAEESRPLENILPDLQSEGSETLNKKVQGNVLFLEGNFSPKNALKKTMTRGKIDLDWNLKLGDDQIKMSKTTHSKINTAFRILRTEEIDQSANGDTKIWPQGIIVATDTLMKIPDAMAWWQCAQPGSYAKAVTKNVYEKSVYPKPIKRQFHSAGNPLGNPAHYKIYLGRMINMYYQHDFHPSSNPSENINYIICVEAAAMFRSCYNLVTDGIASAASSQCRTAAHQFGMLGGKVYDPTPSSTGLPYSDIRNGTKTIEEYIDEWNKRYPPDNQWSIKRRETTHQVSN